jgi:hypothetical protein
MLSGRSISCWSINAIINRPNEKTAGILKNVRAKKPALPGNFRPVTSAGFSTAPSANVLKTKI